MKTCIFLILGFTQLVFCLQITNITEDESYPVCPVKFLRRKRANSEYTRWRSNVDTTPEFIVKVLDDEALPTANVKQVVAVNILPVTKRGEKIIVGGAMLPLPTMMPTSELPTDYTRFMPPTTVPATRTEGELYLAAVQLPSGRNSLQPMKPKGFMKNDLPYPQVNMQDMRHVLRDESPPASPQFLVRSSPPVARQFAPIAAVAFTRRITHTPLTPPYYDSNKRIGPPTRTLPAEDVPPLRTVPEDFPIYQPRVYDVLSNDVFITRTSQNPTAMRTTTDRTEALTFLDEGDDIGRQTTRILATEGRRHEELNQKGSTKINHENEGEISYHNMFLYNEDYKESSKKSEKESTDTYDDKEKEHDENDIIEKEASSLETPEVKFEVENTTESEIHFYPEYDDNSTAKNIVVNETISTNKLMKDYNRERRQQVCNITKLRQLNFNSPRTLPEIVAQLKQWAEDSPVARWIDITEGNFTTMENPIYMMIVDDPSSGQIVSAKQTVMVVAGIQGRDHHAVAAAMYLLYQLIERSEAHADLLTKYRFWIIPVFNPDGYDYSMTFPQKREWTKNLRQQWDTCKERESCRSCATQGLRCTIQTCYGVNLDRNFEYQWIPTEELRAEHPCGPLYAGTRQLSEPETRALTHFLHEQHSPLYTFIAFKEGDVLGVMYPYSHTRKRRAFDHIYRQRAGRAASAAYSISGRPYIAGQTSEFLPLFAGGIEDWVDGHLGIDNTYTIMMFRPTDSYNSKLITERVVHEAYAAMDTLLLQSVEPLGPPIVQQIARSKGPSRLSSTGTVILFVLVIILCS